MLKTAYCSNVHAGANLQETRQNLAEFSCRVRDLVSPNLDEMGIGLWLSAQSARELVADESARRNFSEFLSQNRLDPWTFNGFPHGNFHQPVVKKRVYQPTWRDTARLDYTCDLVELILELSTSDYLSISTLPLDWGEPAVPSDSLEQCARQLQVLTKLMHRKLQETGKLVAICIEPEPGCAMIPAAP